MQTSLQARVVILYGLYVGCVSNSWVICKRLPLPASLLLFGARIVGVIFIVVFQALFVAVGADVDWNGAGEVRLRRAAERVALRLGCART